MVGGRGRAPTQSHQQHEAGERGGGPAQPPAGGPGRRVGHQVAVEVCRVRVGDHQVSSHPLAARQLDAGGPPAFDQDPRHVGVGAHRHPPQQRPAHAPPRPAAGCRPRRARRRTSARRRARRPARRVPGAGRSRCRSRSGPAASAAAGRAGAGGRAHAGTATARRCVRRDVRRASRTRSRGPPSGDSRKGTRVTCQMSCARSRNAVPVGRGTGAERGVHGLAGAGPGGVGHVEPHRLVAVGGREAVAEGRVDLDQVDAVLQRLAGLDEQVSVDRG